jgi:nucleotide-binding universal stress UspA family protein
MSGQTTQTLLVPADFSDCSPELVRHAAGLARELSGRLVILHVVELPAGISEETVIRPQPGGEEVTAGRFLHDRAQGTLGDYAEAVRQDFRDLEVDLIVRTGPVVDQILAAADEVDAKMLVMATHGRSGMLRMVLGSVAERVIRRSQRPVLVLRTQHKPTCQARSCAWCKSQDSWIQSQVRAELDG